MPEDPIFQKTNEETIYFLYSLIKKKREDIFERLGRMLGVYYSSKDWFVKGAGDKHSKKPEELFVPLGLLMNPDFKKVIDQTLARPAGMEDKGQQRFNMNELNKDELLNMLKKGQDSIDELKISEGIN